MTFTQPSLIIAFLLLLPLYWGVRSATARKVLLLSGSLVAYGWVHPWFVVVLLASALIDYAATRCMDALPRLRRVALAFAVLANLSLLLGFKVQPDAFIQLAAVLGRSPGDISTGLLIPLGISFWTFQSLGYTIDVYRGHTHARRSLLDVMLFVAFLPQLVAGPIERADGLLRQIEAPRRFQGANLRSGLTLAAWGLFKKLAIGDVLADEVDRIFILADPAGVVVWTGAVLFGIQLYADFSGYTDIARGVARTLGYELTRNFDRPFLARSTPDFWRRWHISLSRWFGSVVYEPLVRRGAPSAARTSMALIVTFALVGLWHGPGMNFLVLGVAHGVAMSVYVMLGPLAPPGTFRRALPRLLAVSSHMVLVLVPSALWFRVQDVQRAWEYTRLPPWQGTPLELLAAVSSLSLGLTHALPLVIQFALDAHLRRWLSDMRWGGLLHGACWVLAVLAVFFWSPDAPVNFIYFQF